MLIHHLQPPPPVPTQDSTDRNVAGGNTGYHHYGELALGKKVFNSPLQPIGSYPSMGKVSIVCMQRKDLLTHKGSVLETWEGADHLFVFYGWSCHPFHEAPGEAQLWIICA